MAERARVQNAYRIGTLQAALEVLDQFGQQVAWSLGNLTQAVGQPKPSVFRYLRTFEQCGYLTRDELTGEYRPGPKLLVLVDGSARQELMRWRALPPLQDLAERTGETAHVGILHGREVVTVQLVEGRHDVRMHASVGKRSPAHSSSLGKVLLAYFPEPEIDAYLRQAELKPTTPKTIADRGRLKEHLLEIRREGYAIDDEELEIGLCCVAAPITDHTGHVVASVSISAPTVRMDAQAAREKAHVVVESARSISRMLGSPMLTEGGR
jgi:IclR family acetate operon transcriptional repressor